MSKSSTRRVKRARTGWPASVPDPVAQAYDVVRSLAPLVVRFQATRGRRPRETGRGDTKARPRRLQTTRPQITLLSFSVRRVAPAPSGVNDPLEKVGKRR
jgi:hypothetical protein